MQRHEAKYTRKHRHAQTERAMAQTSALRTLALEPRRRCLLNLERRTGNSAFVEVASFAPMTCLAAIPDRLEIVAGGIRNNVLSAGPAHRLHRHLDQPQHPTHKVSADALGMRISTFLCSARDRTNHDPDDVFCLLALRNLDVSWALPDRHSYGEVADDEILLNTPLFLAVATGMVDTVRLLVHLRAGVDGDQWQQFGYEIVPWERQTPLSLAVCSRHPELVKILLQARAEPCGYAYVKHLCDDDLPYGDGYHKSSTPLWDAVHLACAQAPDSDSEYRAKCIEIVRLLLDHRAQPQDRPFVEYYIRFGPGGETIERHTPDSNTTPLRLARANCRADSQRDLVELLSRGV